MVAYFAADGRWIAVATQGMPDRSALGDAADATDLPQPKLYLVQLATGEIRETIVMPQCYPASLCFSPDGKTLASSGQGRVLFWDVADVTSGK